MEARLCAAACLAAALLLAGCGKERPAADPAAEAAKAYYDSLAAGSCGAYVGGMADADSLPKAYRDQLVANAKMFVAAQEEEHGGIDSVAVLRVDTPATAARRDVFLALCFGDSTREEVVVPMVETAAGWRMK